ncbi:NADase-type glycan-binding domain-containing protein [Hyalangium gracile]|uniref:NADase-type glycan-binding domain-containing protein n=1 Tax=Hyalangium gracile TaxID=394092 RepID=UPI001CCE506F|nr:hypothetical protein [Hyalangium gracile]
MRIVLLALITPTLASAAGFQRLHAEQASATSFLKSNWNKYEENYHPSYVLDDDPKTAWVEGAEGDGIGESLTIPLSNLKSARAVRLVIFNGYQKSQGLLAANAAPRQLTISVRGLGGSESARKQVTLERKLGGQSFDIPVTGSVAEVVLTIDSVHPGAKYKDTCVSDVQVFVDSDVPYSAAVEKGKREAMLQWKKGRLEAAKYFASLPKTYPYAATSFEEKEGATELVAKRYSGLVDEDKDGYPDKGVPAKDFVPLLGQIETGKVVGSLASTDVALLQEIQRLSSAPPKEGRWFSLASKGRTVMPENFPIPELMAPLFHLDDATLFEAKGRGNVVPKIKEHPQRGYEEGKVLSNLLLLEGSTTDVKKVYFTYTHIIIERTSTTTTTHGIALLEGGKLTRLVTLESVEDRELAGTATTVNVTVPTYTGGKVSRLETTQLDDREYDFDGPEADSGIKLTKTAFEAQTRS